MARTSGIPIGVDVRERLRTAQRAEAQAIASVQKALAAEAEAEAGARLDEIIVRHQAGLSKAAHAVHAAQATLVRTSGIERAAALLGVSSRVLRSAVKDSALDSRVQATSNNTPAATPAPTSAPTET